ncbi:serine/arginine repetitive matrix protein 1-like [Macrobrachium nipponense]|uniref:serine/arginine repetitive matrix protein 1-like n=1 Tax=Macrobrachium nipponense TaxID=159736 RepID=UPI0030C826E2
MSKSKEVVENPHRSSVPSAGSVVSTQTAMDRHRKGILRKCFSSSDSASPRRGWSSAEESRPLKRSWKAPSSVLDSSPECFPEESPFDRKRARRAPDSPVSLTALHSSPKPLSPSPEGDQEKSTKWILVDLQEQLSTLRGALVKDPPRKKDIALPIKRSKLPPRKRRASRDRSPSPRSSRRLSPVRRSSPVSRASSSKQAPLDRCSPPCRRSSPARRSSPSRRLSPGRRDSPGRRSTPGRRPSPHKRSSPDRRASPRRRSSLGRRSSPARRSPSNRRFSPDRRNSPDRRFTPDRCASPHKSSSPDRRASPRRCSSLNRSASPTRRPSPYRRSVTSRRVSRGSLAGEVASSHERLRVNTEEDLEDVSEEEVPRAAGLSDYNILAALLVQEFGDSLSPAAPPSPRSLFSSTKASKGSSCLKMHPTISMKKALQGVGDWFKSKEEAGKTVFSCPPSKLSGKQGIWYETGEPMGLGLPSLAEADFSTLVDSSRRHSLPTAKTTWGMTELDHCLKGLFRVLEVFNFLDWFLGALARKTLDPEFLGPEELNSILSCMDKAVRDGSGELASLCGAGILKKRAVYNSFLTKSVSPVQRVSLLYAPLSNQLFPNKLVKDISHSLAEKATQDLLAQLSRKVRPAASSTRKEKFPVQEPFRGGPSHRSSFRGRKPEKRGRSSIRPFKRAK